MCKQQWMEKVELRGKVMEGKKVIFHMPFNGLRATE